MGAQSAENVARRPGCEMYGCAAVAVGIGDIDGDEFWLCDGHRYPAPRTAENDACPDCGTTTCGLADLYDVADPTENGLPVLCDERGDRCCGTPACLSAGRWKADPYDEPIGVFEGTRWHMHAEPICADPECVTCLTRSAVATMRARTRVIPPVVGAP